MPHPEGRAAGPQTTADGILAEAIRTDLTQRLEKAIGADALVAGYVADHGAQVLVHVTIDRDAVEAADVFTLAWPDDRPFAGAIGAPAAAAVVADLRRRAKGPGDGGGAEPLEFEIVLNPGRILPAAG